MVKGLGSLVVGGFRDYRVKGLGVRVQVLGVGRFMG